MLYEVITHRYAFSSASSLPASARYRSIRSVWKKGPSSQLIPSQVIPSKIAFTASGVDRSRSVSSMRKMNLPPLRRAKSQLKRAVRAPPIWRYPVGLGAKRVTIFV